MCATHARMKAAAGKAMTTCAHWIKGPPPSRDAGADAECLPAHRDLLGLAPALPADGCPLADELGKDISINKNFGDEAWENDPEAAKKAFRRVVNDGGVPSS